MTVKVLLREGEGWRRERRGRNREERGEGEWHLVFGIEEGVLGFIFTIVEKFSAFSFFF